MTHSNIIEQIKKIRNSEMQGNYTNTLFEVNELHIVVDGECFTENSRRLTIGCGFGIDYQEIFSCYLETIKEFQISFDSIRIILYCGASATIKTN